MPKIRHIYGAFVIKTITVNDREKYIVEYDKSADCTIYPGDFDPFAEEEEKEQKKEKKKKKK